MLWLEWEPLNNECPAYRTRRSHDNLATFETCRVGKYPLVLETIFERNKVFAKPVRLDACSREILYGIGPVY